MESKVVLNDGFTYSEIDVTVTYSGSLEFYVCSDGSTESWEKVSLTSSESTIRHAFSTVGKEVRWKALLKVGASINKIVIEKVN